MMGMFSAAFDRFAPIQTAKSALNNGAVPDGKTLNTAAVQTAINDAFCLGGGVV
jgi:polygalacturonase